MEQATSHKVEADSSGNAAMYRPDSTVKEHYICRVCGDRATGFNYGARTCQACKVFFIRCFTKGKNYKCPADGNCEITPKQKNACSYCRLQKCLNVGMTKQGVDMKPSKMKPPPKKTVQPKDLNLPPCKVCGDQATGFHYGVNTCEACKGFFRRALNYGDKYKCLRKKQCIINPGQKASCTYCRLQKCLEVGMSKEGIKRGRYSTQRKNERQREASLSRKAQAEANLPDSITTSVVGELNGKATNGQKENNSPNGTFEDSDSNSPHSVNHSMQTNEYVDLSSLLNQRANEKLQILGNHQVQMQQLSPISTIDSNTSDSFATNPSPLSNGEYREVQSPLGDIFDMLTENPTSPEGTMPTYSQPQTSVGNHIAGQSSLARICPLQLGDTHLGDKKCVEELTGLLPFLRDLDDLKAHHEQTIANSQLLSGTLYDAVAGFEQNFEEEPSFEFVDIETALSDMPNDTPEFKKFSCPYTEQRESYAKLRAAKGDNATDQNTASYVAMGETLVNHTRTSRCNIECLEDMIMHLRDSYQNATLFDNETIEALPVKEDKYLEMRAMETQLYGSMDNINDEDWMLLFAVTGLDLDGSKSWVARNMTCKVEGAIVRFINFCRSIPRFNLLEARDQTLLVKGSKCDWYILNSYLGCNAEKGLLTDDSGITITKKTFSRIFTPEHADRFFHVCGKMKEKNLVAEERALLVAICVLCTDRQQAALHNVTEIEELQFDIVNGLQYIESKLHPDEPQRFIEIMNILTEMRDTALIIKDMHINVLDKFNIPIPKIMKEFCSSTINA